MRDAVAAFLAAGGNYASFSGNTCFRPNDFGLWGTQDFGNVVRKLGENWPNHDEADLIGLSYGYGGGYWGKWDSTVKNWINLQRQNYGYTIEHADHWVYEGTGVQNGNSFGNGTGDYLVGYEADGLPASTSFYVLGKSPVLKDWEIGGQAAFGMFKDDPATYKHHCVFNCGTTDWARLLTTTCASHFVVQRITWNVLQALSKRAP